MVYVKKSICGLCKVIFVMSMNGQLTLCTHLLNRTSQTVDYRFMLYMKKFTYDRRLSSLYYGLV
jgi:hypothetical protein